MLWLFGLVWPWGLLFAGVATYNAHFFAMPSLPAHPINATQLNATSTLVLYHNATLVDSSDQGTEGAAIDARTLWMLASVLVLVWLGSNIALALLCQREYLRTLWSTEKKNQGRWPPTLLREGRRTVDRRELLVTGRM